jgi:hypothetical protein
VQLFHFIDKALVEAESRSEYASLEPRVWPSEASADAFDKRQSDIVGKCHRSSYFRLIGEPVANTTTPTAARRFRMGRACEADITALAVDAGIHVANGVRCFVPAIILPFELDLVVLDPDTKQGIIAENKSIYGRWSAMDLNSGKPKIEAVMQLCLYLNEVRTGARLKELIKANWKTRNDLDAQLEKIQETDRTLTSMEAEHILSQLRRNRIEVTQDNLDKLDDGPIAGKLTYESRDDCNTWEFDVGIYEDELDGLHYPQVDGQPWKLFTLESVYQRYATLQGFWYRAREAAQQRLASKGINPPDDMQSRDGKTYLDRLADEVRQLPPSFWPPAEYQLRYSDDKINMLFNEGLISKTKFGNWQKQKQGSETIGDWHCAYCNFKSRCVSVEYPELRHLALDLMQDEAARAAFLNKHTTGMNTMRVTNKTPKVRKGQVWMDNDPRDRGQRTLTVMRVSRINQTAIVQNQDTKKETTIALRRFNGRRNGYVLLNDRVAA